MLSPRLTDCPECANIPSLLRKIDCKLAELGNNLYNNISYMLNKPVPADDMLQLIGYRRILTHKLYNYNYVSQYSIAMIASRVIRLTSGCVSKCNEPERCLEEPCNITIVPNPSTTTTTSSTTTSTTTTAGPTTTTTSSSSTSTTTSTSSSTTTTTTTACVNRPIGLTNGNLIQAVNNPGDPSRNFSNVSVAYACDTFNYFRSVPIITGSGASYIDMQYSTLAIGEVIYKDNNETNCVRVPNGFYWFQPNITSPITYFKSINQISIVTTVGGVITAIDICDYVPPTTTTTTTI
jgi:hypothetical protein